MAKFNADAVGLDATIRQLEGADLFDTAAQERILRVGAAVVAESARRNAQAHRRSGAMADNIGINGGVRQAKGGYSYMEVSILGSVARGKHRKIKTRNAVKGFVVNYGRQARPSAKKGGRGKIQATHFWTNAVTASREKSIQAMQDEAKALLQEKGV